MLKPLSIAIKANLALQLLLTARMFWIWLEHSHEFIILAMAQSGFFLVGCLTWFLIRLDKPRKADDAFGFSQLWLFLGIVLCVPAVYLCLVWVVGVV